VEGDTLDGDEPKPYKRNLVVKETVDEPAFVPYYTSVPALLPLWLGIYIYDFGGSARSPRLGAV
jgi:hypothetical protein